MQKFPIDVLTTRVFVGVAIGKLKCLFRSMTNCESEGINPLGTGTAAFKPVNSTPVVSNNVMIMRGEDRMGGIWKMFS